jgi:hypothetical protein
MDRLPEWLEVILDDIRETRDAFGDALQFTYDAQGSFLVKDRELKPGERSYMACYKDPPPPPQCIGTPQQCGTELPLP